MKKSLLLTALVLSLGLTACGGTKDITEEVNQTANALQGTMGNLVIEPSEYVLQAVCGIWEAADKEVTYEFKEDKTGSKLDESFTFECGFDSDNHITLRITMDETGAEELYAISSDTTGYGMEWDNLSGEADIWMLPANLEFIEMTDERAAVIVGEWRDASGNQYIFEENKEMTIVGSKGESEGTYSVVQNEEGIRYLKLVTGGGSLEFEYELDEDGKTIRLNSPGDSNIHEWTKKQSVLN